MDTPGAISERRSLDRGELWGVGLAATAVALGVLWAAASFTPSAPFPPVSAAEAFLRAIPGDLATFFIETLGGLARPLLALGAVVGTLVFGAFVLVRTAKDGAPRGIVAASALAAVSVAAILIGPGDDYTVVAVALTLAAAATAYVLVVRRLHRSIALTSSGDSGRRDALRYGFGLAAAVGLGGGVIGWISNRVGGPNTDVRLVAPANPVELPEDGGFPDIPGLSSEITSVDSHYEVDINLVPPIVQADSWTLKVHGLVDEPLELTFASLQERFEVVEEYQTLACISNEVGGDLVGNSLWGGVRLREVLEAAGVGDGAVDVVFHAADGYTDSIPVDVALEEQVLVAVSHNRAPLTQRHGFPCRIRVPKIFGMKNVKWLTEIEVVGEDYLGYWMKRGWSDEAEVRMSSRIDVPTNGSSIPTGAATWIAGVAWAGDRGISKVEVSVDGGQTWADAQLKEPVGPYSWTLWALRWDPRVSGPTVVTCRATDGQGDLQVAIETPPHPSGATGLHRVALEVT